METNSTEYIEGVNSNQIVLSVLQEQFPGLTQLPSAAEAEYVSRTVTPVYETAGAINHYPELIPLDRSENGVIQIDGDDDTKSLNIPLQKLTFVDADNYNEIIDTDYHYFIDVVDDDVDDLPDIVGKFIIMPKKSIPTINGPTSDIHLSYMLGDSFPNLEYLQVFYGKEVNGRPILYRIPDYKTLEVMLVAREQRYNAIRIIEVEVFNKLIRRTLNDTLSIESLNAINDAITTATENNSLTLDQRLNMYVKELPVEVSQLDNWTVQTRFNSGYKPDSPFNRDPVDYIGQSVGVDLPTNFDKATSLEKLRDKYEGRIVLFKNLKEDRPGAFVSKGAPDADDLEGCRMLFYGRWRPVFSLDILTLYGAETGGDISFRVDNGGGGQSGFNQSLPVGASEAEEDAFNSAQEYRFNLLRGALRKLVDSGVIIILNEDGNNSPIWNSFPHVLRPLEVAEYKTYLKLADVFDVEYLAPYEPRGSIKYYDPLRNGARGSELFSGNRLVDANSSAPESLKVALNEQIESEMNRLNDGMSDSAILINALQVEINDLIDWKRVADDIVDGENNRFKYVVSNSVNVLKRGTGTRSLDNYFEGAAIGSGIGTAVASFFTFGLAAVPGTLGTAAYARAADQFEFGNPQERLYKDKINTLSTEYDQLLSASAGLMQVAELKIDRLESIRNEINADTFITAFDNYQARINDIDAEGMIATIGANISQMRAVRTNSIDAYTHFLGILNREIGQANDGLRIMDMQVSIQNFRDSLATTVDLDENIINNLI